MMMRLVMLALAVWAGAAEKGDIKKALEQVKASDGQVIIQDDKGTRMVSKEAAMAELYKGMAAEQYSKAMKTLPADQRQKASAELRDLRSGASDADAVRVDPKLLEKSSCHRVCTTSWLGTEHCQSVCTAVAAVRGSRALDPEIESKVKEAEKKVDEKDAMASARAYAQMADAAKPDTATKKAKLKQLAELLETISDADYPLQQAPAVHSRKDALATAYTTLAGLEYKDSVAAGVSEDKRALAEAALSQKVKDTDAVAVNPETLTETGWWSDLSSYVERRHYDTRWHGTAVAAVRGGRKIAAGDDKEAMDLMSTIDALGKKMGEATTASARGELHFETARAYDRLAQLTKKAQPAEAAKPAAAAEAPKPAAPAAVAAELTPKQVYQKAGPAVVLIISAGKDGMGELGTGSLIAADRVLTNAHVVIKDADGRPFDKIKVYAKPDRVTGDPKTDLRDPVAARVVKYDRDLDLAVLQLDERLARPIIKMGDSEALEPGEAVVAIGHPEQGGLWTLTTGVVSTVVADLGGVKGKHVFQTDASINRGNSGGPLLDRSGNQIGVNTSMARRAADGLTITAVNFAVKTSVVRDWLGGEAPALAAAEAPRPSETPKAVEAPKPAEQPKLEQPKLEQPKAEAPKVAKPAPKIVTPPKPYKIEDLIEKEMAEMEDMESEMRGEIEKRREGLNRKP